MQKNKIILVTGLSGAGKTTAMRVLEDIGYHCIDQYPVELLGQLYDLVETSTDERYHNLALATTVQDLGYFINTFNCEKFDVKVLLLEASTDALISRYQQSRKVHPLILSQQTSTLKEAIELETKLYRSFKDIAYLTIDTTFIHGGILKKKVQEYFEFKDKPPFSISLISFGHKTGLPADADIVVDVRFLPNPFWDSELREKTGLDQEVYDYVISQEVTQEFLPKITDFLNFVTEAYQKEGKNHCTICIGCTGGQHRSVSIVRFLNEVFQEKYHCYMLHRDLGVTDEK